MSEIFNNNKIFYHGDRIKEYLDSKHTSSPITVTLDLTNRCNNKCPHCISYLKDKKDLDYNILRNLLKDLKNIGVRGIVITGGGEPLLYNKLIDSLEYGKRLGLNFGMITSGQSDIREKEWLKILKCLNWIRFSLDAGSPSRYKFTHGLSELKFNKIIKTINKITNLKINNNLNITIGVGYIVNLQEPNKELEDVDKAVRLVCKKGLNYFQLRPVLVRSDNKDSRFIDYLEITKEYVNNLNYDIKLYNTSLQRRVDRKFRYCHGGHFITSICANGKVYYCCILKNMNKGEVGDLNKQSFREIWNDGNVRKIGNNINVNNCPNRCKNNIINNCIEELMDNKDEHTNFL